MEDALINYGALGIIVVLFIIGAIVSKKEHDRVIAERDRAYEQRDALLEDVTTKVVPALERAAEATEVLVDVRRLLENQ